MILFSPAADTIARVGWRLSTASSVLLCGTSADAAYDISGVAQSMRS